MPDIEDFNRDFNAFNEALVKEFRESNGHVTGMFGGAPLVLITTPRRSSRRTARARAQIRARPDRAAIEYRPMVVGCT